MANKTDKLPDSSFAYIEDNGKRHFQFKDKNGKVDLALLKEALEAAPQSIIGAKAIPRLKAAAKKMKVGEYADDWKGGIGIFQAQVKSTSFREELGDKQRYKPNDEKKEVVLPLLVEGWGNTVDNNYYTAKAVTEAASYLQSRRKMYFNHPKSDADDRDMRDWAASIQETWTDQLSNGKTVAWGRTKIYDNWLWERIKEAPDEIADSVIGRGKATRGVMDGKEGNIVESIEYVRSCDFVDYAGNVPFGMAYFVENQKWGNTNNKEDDEMKLEEITIGMLKENRSELITEIEKSAKEEAKKDMDKLDTKIVELETSVAAKDKEISELKKKVDDNEVKIKMKEKEDAVSKLLVESKLPDTAKTPLFTSLLMECKESKDDKGKVITETESMQALLKDRETLIGIKEEVITNMGAGSGDIKESEAQEDFNQNILGMEKKEDKK